MKCAPRMTSPRGHDPCFAQKPHRAPNDNRVGAKALTDGVGGHGAIMLCHVQKRVQNGGKAAVSFHVTIDVTNMVACQDMSRGYLRKPLKSVCS